MEHLQTLANVATILTLVVSSTVAAAGIVPRAGPGRALVLAVKSLTRVAKTPSARSKEVTALVGLLRDASSNQYIVVTGKKGVGKSVVVDTTTQRTCGVISIPVAPGSSQRTIVMDALSEVANSRISVVDPRASVRRILWWYRWLLPPPIVVLRAGERLDGQIFAEVPGRTRTRWLRAARACRWLHEHAAAGAALHEAPARAGARGHAAGNAAMHSCVLSAV